MPRLSVDAQLAKIKKQKAALEKQEHELLARADNKELDKIVALIKKAGLTAQDITAAMKGSKKRKATVKSKLAGKKIPPNTAIQQTNRRRGLVVDGHLLG